MVPGQDPDLRAPAPRAACLREVSIQLQPQTAGSKKSSSFLVRRTAASKLLYSPATQCVFHVFRIQLVPRHVESSRVLVRLLPETYTLLSRLSVSLIPDTISVSVFPVLSCPVLLDVLCSM